MLTRVAAVGAAAAVVLVVAPGLVVKAINPTPGVVVAAVEQQPVPAAPPEASLKLGITGSRDPYLVRLHAKGHPPKQARLVDEAGTNTALVTDAPGRCAHRTFHDTLVGWHEWCLAVSGLDPGTTVSGSVIKGTKLTLTLTRRHRFWWWPFFVLVAGLLAPLATGWTMKWLRRHAGLDAVARVIDRNERSRNLAVTDLRTWAEEQEDAGMAPGDLRAHVQDIVQGPRQIRAARKALAAQVAQTSIPHDHPYLDAARKEANRRSVRVEDILDPDFKPKVAFAATLLHGLRQIEADARLIDALKPLLDQLNDDCGRPAREALDEAELRLANADTPEKVEALGDAIIHANAVLLAAAETPNCLRVPVEDWNSELIPVGEKYLKQSAGSVPRASVERALRDRDQDSWTDIVQQLRSVTASPLELTGKSLWRDELYARGVTVGALGVVLGFAALTVEQTAYAPNATFASFWDGFTLFSAAFASGTAAAVLTLVDYWRPQPSGA